MAVLDTREAFRIEDLSILPDLCAPEERTKPINPFHAAINTIDFFGTIAGSLVGLVAQGITSLNDFIDKRL